MQSAPTAAIALSGVTNAYALRRAPSVRALEAIDLQVARGEFAAPAEGLVDPDTGAVFPWTTADLLTIYDRYGSTVSTIVLEAMARIDPDVPGCPCAERFRGGPVHDYERFLEAQ